MMNKTILFSMLGIAVLFASFASAATDNQKTIGDLQAELTMEIYTDFQDPFSSSWYEQTLPQLKEEYIEDGELKIVFRHFPLPFHTDAIDRAKAAECAAEQSYFIEFVEKFYRNLDIDTNIDYYKEIANSLNVNNFNFVEFKECFNDPNTENKINSEFNMGQSREVSGIPHFFVKDKQMIGAQPFSEFKVLIDSLLKNKQNMQEEPVRGNGKVKIIGYMGYNDPYSKRAWTTIDELFKEFDENKIRFEFRNFPLVFQDPEYKLAQTGECVLSLSDSKTFFKFSSLVMGDKEILSSAAAVGINKKDIEKCLSDKKFLSEVLDDMKKGEKMGVEQSTPVFFINDKKISGAQQYEVFAKIIKNELNGDFEELVQETPTVMEIENGEQCASGCQLENSCIQFGQRVEVSGADSYCSFSGKFEKQKQLSELCQNNYECFSNQCSNKECVDIQKQLEETQGLLEKILNWFNKLFG